MKTLFRKQIGFKQFRALPARALVNHWHHRRQSRLTCDPCFFSRIDYFSIHPSRESAFFDFKVICKGEVETECSLAFLLFHSPRGRRWLLKKLRTAWMRLLLEAVSVLKEKPSFWGELRQGVECESECDFFWKIGKNVPRNGKNCNDDSVLISVSYCISRMSGKVEVLPTNP